MLKSILFFFLQLIMFFLGAIVKDNIPSTVDITSFKVISILSFISILIILIGKKPLMKIMIIICIIFNMFWIEMLTTSIRSPYPIDPFLFMDIAGFIGSTICTILVSYKIYKNYKSNK